MQNIEPRTFENIQIDNEFGRTELVGPSGAGGGGTNIPPIISDTNGNFNILLTSTDAAEYFDGANSLGVGVSQTVFYSPVTTFGSSRTYTAKIDNKVATNYFVVFLNREFRGYNQQTSQPTYYESIRASEYRLKPGSQTEYEFFGYKYLAGVVGTMQLPFLFETKRIKPIEGDPIDIIPSKSYAFDIIVKSNFTNELGNVISIDYNISDLLKGNIPLSNENSGELKLSEDNIKSSNLVLTIKGNLPKYYGFENIKIGSYSSTDRTITVPASIIKTGNINVDLTFNKNIPQPSIITSTTQFNADVKDSDSDKSIEIVFDTINANSVDVKFPNGNVKNITTKSFIVSFKNDFAGSYDLQKLVLTPILD